METEKRIRKLIKYKLEFDKKKVNRRRKSIRYPTSRLDIVYKEEKPSAKRNSIFIDRKK